MGFPRVKVAGLLTARLATFQCSRSLSTAAAMLVSNNEAVSNQIGTVNWTREPARATLDMNLIQSIKTDLKKADSDRDGKLDFEDFKSMLHHDFSHLFSGDEIEEIGELLFVGKAGQAVRTSVMLRGICHVALDPNSEKSPNPLNLASLEDRRNKNDSRDNEQPFYSTQEVFDAYMLRYVEEKTSKL